MSAPAVLQSLMISPEMNSLATLLAHEFRVPVHALEAYLSVLKEERAGPMNEVQLDFVMSMFSIVRRLERLTHDVEIMAATDGTFPIVFDDVNALEIVDACIWELKPLGDGYGVQFDLDVDRNANFNIRGDSVRIEQIVLNLLENAIRYSPSRSAVKIRLRQSASRISMLFENETAAPFEELARNGLKPSVRGPMSSDLHPQGSGLGLSVVDQLVRSHRGKVIITTRGKLVRFLITLPRKNTSGDPTP